MNSKALIDKSSKQKSLMPVPEENKNKLGELLGDIILGGQDGLVNTLGVILGIAAASSDFRIIVAGGLAGAIAESVSMGAVGYTSKIAERDFYLSQLEKEKKEMAEMPEIETQEIRDIYRKKGFSGKILEEIVKVITSNHQVWLSTMMQEELQLSPMEFDRPLKAAGIIGFSSFVGALIPIVPFILFYLWGNTADNIQKAMISVIILAAICLFIVGAIKSRITIGKWYKSGFQMMIIGVISALFGYLVGFLFTI
jgi:VIT1/CCC1 family predicted Fe2+/Mn2+ transporter